MEIEIRREYHLNGNLDYELSYLNGRAHGVQKEYYENGQICCQYYIESGSLLMYQEWLENSQRHHIQKYSRSGSGIRIDFKY